MPTISIRMPRCTWCGQQFDANHALVGLAGTTICEACADLATMSPKTVIHLLPESARAGTEPKEARQ